MSPRAAAVPLALALVLVAALPAAAAELRGAAILDHPCGKTAATHMGLVHAGRMDEALKLGSPELVEKWQALPAEDREMMTGMMKELSKPEAEFRAEIAAHGVLTVDSGRATLVVEKKVESDEGSSTETHTQHFAVDGASCLIAP